MKTGVLKTRRRLRKAWQYLTSYIPSRRAGGLFAHVRTFCMFIGYPRSGHTLVGSLVDAHPNAIIANELNIVGHVIRDCAGIVFGAPRQTRWEIAWPSADLEVARTRVLAFPWLRHYADEP